MKGVFNVSNASTGFLAQPNSQIDSKELTSKGQELLDKKMHVPRLHESGKEGKGGGET